MQVSFRFFCLLVFSHQSWGRSWLPYILHYLALEGAVLEKDRTWSKPKVIRVASGWGVWSLGCLFGIPIWVTVKFPELPVLWLCHILNTRHPKILKDVEFSRKDVEKCFHLEGSCGKGGSFGDFLIDFLFSLLLLEWSDFFWGPFWVDITGSIQPPLT